METKKNREPSLREIAQEVGFSHVHVYRILHKNKGHFSKAAEQRVREARKTLRAQKKAA